MARPPSGSNLSLAALNQMMEARRAELNKLKHRRSELQRDLDRVERQIFKIEGAAGRRGGNGRVRNEKSLNDTIDEVLRSGGKPMRVGDIVDAVLGTGYRSNSANFRGIVNQTLIKDKRFHAPERGMYALKK
jgi:hypothetical protein